MSRRTLWLLVVVALLLAGVWWRYRPLPPVVVTVLDDGVDVDGTRGPLFQLDELLRPHVTRQPDLRVIVRIDDAAPGTLLIAVMDEVERAGATDVDVQLLP